MMVLTLLSVDIAYTYCRHLIWPTGVSPPKPLRKAYEQSPVQLELSNGICWRITRHC